MLRSSIDYDAVMISVDEAREKIQNAIDAFTNKDIDKKLLMVQKLKIHAFVRARFAYCYKYAEGKVYTPDACDPDKVCELFNNESRVDADESSIYVYICCLLRDAINDYYRNLQRYRVDKKSCTEDWKESGMTEEEFADFYTKRSLVPRKIIKRQGEIFDEKLNR